MSKAVCLQKRPGNELLIATLCQSARENKYPTSKISDDSAFFHKTLWNEKPASGS